MKSRWLRILAAVVLLAILAFGFRERILFSLGAVLVHDEVPTHADVVVVLGGDARGQRILKAAQLVKDGYAPVVLVSGGGGQYGYHESYLAIEFAVRHGYPRESFAAITYPAVSTFDESRENTKELRRRGAHRYILVTSLSHTARATRMFRKAAPDLEIHTVAAPQANWDDGRWWTNREGQKIWLQEAMKTVAEFLHI